MQVHQEMRIDFKDTAQFIQFLFRNLVLQKRWDQLRSQEIGATFVSGGKPAITKTLSLFESLIDISKTYDCAGDYKIKYTRRAFTKNLRAFRRIGLIQALGSKPPHLETGTKFKGQIMLVKALPGDIHILSAKSHRRKVSNHIVATQHLRQLAQFIDRFGSDSLVAFLRQSKKASWYSHIPFASIHNIDAVNLDEIFLDPEFARKLVPSLCSECKKHWEKAYSSFV